MKNLVHVLDGLNYKTKLLGILKDEIFGLSLNSETWLIVNCPSPGRFSKREILCYPARVVKRVFFEP